MWKIVKLCRFLMNYVEIKFWNLLCGFSLFWCGNLTDPNQTFNTDILRNLNTFEHDTGEFFLTKDLVAFSFDSMIDRMIIMNYQGAVEVLEDEFYIEFKVLDKINISSAKTYELVFLMYQPRLLRVNAAAKDVSINF